MLIGKKMGMTRIFDEAGVDQPVTMVEAGPCIVTQLKTEDNDGYSAMQVGYMDLPESKITKPSKGHFQKSKSSAKRYLKEFPVLNSEIEFWKDLWNIPLLLITILMLIGSFNAYTGWLAIVGLGNWLPFFWAFWAFQPYLQDRQQKIMNTNKIIETQDDSDWEEIETQ